MFIGMILNGLSGKESRQCKAATVKEGTWATLNEVPGNESRQSAGRFHALAVRVRPSMKCREMNPGNGHILTHTISRAAIENCERSNISHPFSRIIQDTNAEKDIE